MCDTFEDNSYTGTKFLNVQVLLEMKRPAELRIRTDLIWTLRHLNISRSVTKHKRLRRVRYKLSVYNMYAALHYFGLSAIIVKLIWIARDHTAKHSKRWESSFTIIIIIKIISLNVGGFKMIFNVKYFNGSFNINN